MAHSNFFLVSFVVLAFLGVASAKYRAGRSLKPYPYDYDGSYRVGRSMEPYEPEEYEPIYNAGHSLHPYKPQDKNAAIKIQGMIYCRRYKNLVPMQGATARVTCMVKDKYGYERAPFSVNTPLTDKKGYFLINLAKNTIPGYTFSNCKVFLDEPAQRSDCRVPTNTNNGLYGAPLSKPRRLSDKSILFSVAPFAFTTPSNY